MIEVHLICVCSSHAASPLEGYEPHEWVAFERALVVRDIFTGGVRTFLNTLDAQAFRAAIYKQYGKQVLSSHSSNSLVSALTWAENRNPCFASIQCEVRKSLMHS